MEITKADDFFIQDYKLSGNYKTIDKKRTFIQFYLKTFFHIGKSCYYTKISRQTYYDWIRNDPEFEKCIQHHKEIIIDIYQSKLDELAMQGNLRAIIFFLERKGGYEKKYIPEFYNCNGIEWPEPDYEDMLDLTKLELERFEKEDLRDIKSLVENLLEKKG